MIHDEREWTANIYLPEGSEPIPVRVGAMHGVGGLRSLAAELLAVPGYRVSFYNSDGDNEQLVEMNPEAAEQLGLQRDMDIFVFVSSNAGQRDPPGITVHALEEGTGRETGRDESAAAERATWDMEFSQTEGWSEPDSDSWSAAVSEYEASSTDVSGIRPASLKIDMEKFVDPINFTLLADPVVLSDGNTYDRPTIEQHFAARRQAALDRQTAGSHEDEDAPTCCGRREEIQLTSPLTGEVVSAVLIPNRHVEQQVVEHVETGSFDLSPEDLADWLERRQNKRNSDRIRHEHERMEREAATQRQENAARAQELRNAEDKNEKPNTAPTLEENAASAFRIVREQDGANSASNFGLAVPLCALEAKMDRTYFMSLGSHGRCLVHCCAKRLSEGAAITNCDRCGRVTCEDCLAFSVSDYHDHSNTSSARICTECVMQLTDSMPRDGEVGRCRAIIIRTKLSNTLEAIFSRAAGLVDVAEAELGRQRYNERIQRLENEIQELESTQRGLEAEIHFAETATQQAEEDGGGKEQATALDSATSGEYLARASAPSGNVEETSSLKQCGTVAELRELCRGLDERLDVVLGQVPPQDEEQRLEHIQTISGVRHRLEEASLELGSAMSRELLTHASNPTKVGEISEEDKVLERNQTINGMRHRPKEASPELGSAMSRERLLRARAPNAKVEEAPSLETMGVSDLQSLLLSLQLELQTNSREVIGDEAAVLEHVMAQSSLSHRIEDMQNHLLTALKTGTQHPNPLQSSTTNDDGAPCDRLERLQREYFALVAQRESTQDQGTLSDLVIRISELEATLHRAQCDHHAKAPHFSDQIDDGEGDCFREWWEALGAKHDDDWPLPFGLEYPTRAMLNQIELLRNRLKETKLQRQAHHEEWHTSRIRELQNRIDGLEDSVAQLRSQVTLAQEAAAAAEQERLAARRERDQREEEERQRREQERLEQQKLIQEEQDRLRAKHEQDESATRDALQRAVGMEDNARIFGGSGDLRMCGRCKSGPFENAACSDLAAHNDTSMTYKGISVASTSNPNHCLHCGWFDSHWHNWPKWDGIEGPH